MRNYLCLGTLLFLSICACEKDEEARPGVYLEDRVGFSDMVSTNGKDYQKQIYFDLSKNKNVGANYRDVWDLAFSCDPLNPNIFVNSSLLMKVAKTGIIDFDKSLNPNDYQDDFEYERSKSYFSKGHIKSDFSENGIAGQVFLIDLGLNLNNQSRGFKKLQILQYKNGSYKLQIADPNSNSKEEFTVAVDGIYNNVFISFSKVEEVLKLEPPKEDWDILFSKYMQKLFDGVDTVDYSVTGCLLNPYKTKAYLYQEFSGDSTLSFYNLSASDIQTQNFSISSDVVGHDWKNFDLNGTGKFLIRPKWFYFIQDNEGINYRLRFTGFYNENGDKGAVTFEYLEL